MTVADLIVLLQKQPQELQVAYEQFSEQCLLEEGEVRIVELCEARPDGWIHHRRDDKPCRKYLLLPGN